MNNMAKITDKLSKVGEQFSIYRYDNGFMIEVSGKDAENDWKTAKVLCTTEAELVALIKETISLPLDD